MNTVELWLQVQCQHLDTDQDKGSVRIKDVFGLLAWTERCPWINCEISEAPEPPLLGAQQRASIRLMQVGGLGHKLGPVVGLKGSHVQQLEIPFTDRIPCSNFALHVDRHRYDRESILSVVPESTNIPYDIREVIARIVDGLGTPE